MSCLDAGFMHRGDAKVVGRPVRLSYALPLKGRIDYVSGECSGRALPELRSRLISPCLRLDKQ